MKKTAMYCLALVTLFLISTVAFSQAGWQHNDYKKEMTLQQMKNKVGIGINTPLQKMSIKSLENETPLGLIGYGVYSAPFIDAMSSAGTSMWKLYVTASWWVIGTAFDSTTSVISAKPSSSWIRANYTWSFSTLKATSATITTGAITTLTGTTSTYTNTKSTTDSVTTLVSTTSTLGTADADSLTTPIIYMTAITDSTVKRLGLVVYGADLYWGNGTYYYKVTVAN